MGRWGEERKQEDDALQSLEAGCAHSSIEGREVMLSFKQGGEGCSCFFERRGPMLSRCREREDE